MMRLAILLVALVACETPVPSLRIRLTEGPTQSCGTTSCSEVPLACKTWISIRIIDPADPMAPFLSQCQLLSQTGNRDLCSVARVDLDPTPLPITDLEVRIALYPESMIMKDPVTNEDICPSTEYDAVNGFPIESEMAPALGGRAYYRPGDEIVTVTLGCTSLELVNDAECVGLASVRVAATVDDFDTGLSIGLGDADQLSVTTGEPKSKNSQFELNPGDVTSLQRAGGNVFPPAWATDINYRFVATACLAVLDDAPQSTTTVTCQDANVTDDDLTFTGVRLSKLSLDQILRTLSLTQFPTLGLTIGIVLDNDGDPLPGQVISVPMGTTIQYLSSDRNSIVGTSTSGGLLGGVFVSTDAPFGTLFSTSGGTPSATVSALGGRIQNKVTIVALRFKDPVIED